MKFVLEIELGNDFMQTGSQVIEALKRIESSIYFPNTDLDCEISPVSIRDLNGNTVGKWEVQS